jgi:hypothetical protein
MDLNHTGSSIRELVYNIAGDKFKDFVTIAFGWKKIVGSILAQRSFVEKLDNKVLFISVHNNVWMQELILRKSELISDFNSKMNIHIEDIVFFIKSKGLKTNFRKYK